MAELKSRDGTRRKLSYETRARDVINQLMGERLRFGIKDKVPGHLRRQERYAQAIGPIMKGRRCPTCGTPLEKMNHGGGQVYLCPKCQK